MTTTSSVSEVQFLHHIPVAKQFVRSDRMYCSGYRPHPLDQQVKRLMPIFPGLIWFNPDDAPHSPPDAEGAFLIPRWPLVSRSYASAVNVMLMKLLVARNGNIVSPSGLLEFLKEEANKRERCERLRGQQMGTHYLVVHAQFGLHHRGQSVLNAKSRMDGDEFGLGLFEAIAMLLTHPERLAHNDDLGILCAGDEYRDKEGGPIRTPRISFCGSSLIFDSVATHTASKDDGVASMMFR